MRTHLEEVLVMKKTTAFLIIACLLLSVITYAQQISFSKKNATIEDLQKVIEEKTEYTLFYQRQYLSLLKPVSIHITNGTLEQLLNEYFKYQAFEYTYIEKTITIKPRETQTTGVKLVNIKGKISNEKGEPIPNATVTVNGNKQVITNENGEFILNGVNNANLNIVITSVNYEPEEINLQGQEELDIRLKQHISELSKVSVFSTGYQKLTKEKTPGSFTKIDNELLNRRVSTNIIDRLEGITSGLVFNKNINPNVNQSSITIRTRSTIYANPNPLIIVDNFPYTGGDINNINPNDVESITVLKDADAASIWGAYSGNGVIVVTTKKGKYNQPLRVSFNSNVTLGLKPDLYYAPVVNSKDYVELEQYLFDNNFYKTIENNPGHPALSSAVEILIKKRDGKISAADADAQLNALKSQDKRKDIEKYLYRNKVNQQYNISATGGSYNNNYYFSVGYDKNLDNLVKNQFNRITLTANNSFSMLKKKLELNTGIVYTETSLKNNNQGALPVNYPYLKLTDDNGNPLPVNVDIRQPYKDTAGKAFLLDWNYRPLDELRLSDNNTNASDYRINADLKYSIIRGLDLTVLYQYNRGLSEQQDYKSLQSYYTRNLINQYTQVDSNGKPFRPIPLGGILDQVAKRYEANNTRVQLNYNYNWYNANHTKNHLVTAIAGSEVRSLETHTETLRFYGYNKDQQSNTEVNYNRAYKLFNDPISPPKKIDYRNKNNSTTDRYISYYVNAKYIYQRKYILSASARKDESNLFGVDANKKGVPLWSVGASWDISQEKFYHVAWLPYLRIRATNGYNGNVDKSVSAYTTAYINPQNSWGVPSGTIINPPNPMLRWEKNHTVNIGADFAVKNNIIEGSLEYYMRKSTDLIGNSPLDPTTGSSTFRGNTADMKGKGVDITLHTKNINRQLKWNTNLLFSYAADKVTNYKLKESAIWYYSDPQYFYPLQSKPVYSISGLKWMGLDPQNGDPLGYLTDHVSKDYSEIINSSNFDNLVYKGAANPTFFGSLRNVFDYKQFELSFNITWKMGYYFRSNSIRYYNLFNGSAGHSDYEKRWRNPGDEKFTSVPSLAYPGNRARDDFYSYSEILIEKGDHIRLQDIQFSYDLLKDNNKKLPFQLLRFYVYANNIGLIWKANKKGIDPDYIFDTPQPRTVAAGIKINF